MKEKYKLSVYRINTEYYREPVAFNDGLLKMFAGVNN